MMVGGYSRSAFKSGVQNPSDILNHDRTGANLFHKSNPIR